MSCMLFLSSSSTSVAAASLAAIGAALEHYAVYAGRFQEPELCAERHVQKRMAGLLLKGLRPVWNRCGKEALQILGEELFASQV